MKAITFSFTRDWQTARSIPGTGEVEHEPAGRDKDTATYVVAESYHETLARAQLEDDFKRHNICDIQVTDVRDVRGIVHLLAACYGAGLVRQGQIAGEYPPPPVDVPETPGIPRADADAASSGTITGRFTRTYPPFHEQKPSRLHRTANDPRTEHLAKVDYSQIEARILAHMETPPEDLGRFDCSGNYRWPTAYATGSRKLSELSDGVHPTHDRVTRTSINISQMLEQAAVAQDKLEEWHKVLREAGFLPAGDGPLADTWIKEDDDESA